MLPGGKALLAVLLSYPTLLFAQAEPAVLLTPGTMAEHGFSIECRFIDHTVK